MQDFTSEFRKSREIEEQQLTQSRSLHLLLIEDVSADAELVILELAAANINVTYDVAATSAECQQFLRETSYDAVLSDYRLPNLNGLQALQYLQQSSQDIPFILVTGSLGEEAAVECIKAGMTDYVLKDRLFRLPLVLHRALAEFDLRQQQREAIAKIQRQAWRETIINRILQAMRGTLILDEVLQITANLLQESLQVSHCLIFRPDHNGKMRSSYIGKLPSTLHQQQDDEFLGIYCGFYDFYQQRLAQGDQIAIERVDEDTHTDVRELAESYGILSMLITPLIYQNIYCGGISLYFLEHHGQWSEEVRSLVKVIANQCAIAIHQANLYQSAQKELMERQKIEAQLRHDAFHDVLTGLPNRSLFLDRLNHAMHLSQRRSYVQAEALPSADFAVMFLDLDRFKLINDSLGHLAGDVLLQTVAERLVGCLRTGDTVARLGGDEFVMLLESINGVKDVIDVAQRIQERLKLPILINGQEIFVSTSIGIALNSSNYLSPEELLRDADTAMYRAKESGRDRYEVFTTVMHSEAFQRLRLENELRRAIERHEFILQYQPIVCLQSKKIIGLESLIRWQHPERGIIYPASFVPLAEDIGLIVMIDFWVLQEACRQMQIWQQLYPATDQLTIHVNLSARQFNQYGLTEQINQILAQTNLRNANLKIEITESILLEKTAIANQILSELSDQNVRICIDDFGTGYSSLSYLHQFPIHTLKIDRSFISHLKMDSGDGEIVKAIIILGINLGLNVIAEGIETEEQLNFLKFHNCHAGQGHHLFSPLNADEVAKLLDNLMPDDTDLLDPITIQCQSN